ncbi:efflux RND transporter permease subunit [Thioclava sp. BHET1]|nr:efflux RND transporter permease subunit [Thioclava sp. BHET1]
MRFNLSDWALRHRSFVWYLMIVSLIAGVMSYMTIGREEDPNFAVKTMVIQATLPGATVQDTLNQVTDRIEKKLKELPELDFTRSITRPGVSVVYVNVLPSIKGGQLPAIWQKVRNMMADIRPDFPSEFGGFQFNDDFGDVFGDIYAFTSDGFSPREVEDYVKIVQRQVQALPDSGKVELFGTQDEMVYLEFSSQKLAALGLNEEQVQATLAAQNAILPSGTIDAGPEKVLVRLGGQFADAQSLAGVNLRVGDRFFKLTDVATIRATYQDPPDTLFRYRGAPAIGLKVGMRPGANIVDFGKELTGLMTRVKAELPYGIAIHQTADQPKVVSTAVNGFLRALAEAVGIVLIVSFISLGLRAGLVVTVTIPLVLALTFVIIQYLGFSLQRVSLGALIIALGLLVDDAMITIETMISRLERGESRTKAASYAWSSIAFPMLSGTLVTVTGFIPIGLNDSSAGEFTFSLFVVIAVSLLLSWIAAVLFAPLLGATMLPRHWPQHGGGSGRLRRGFHAVLRRAMRFHWITIALTVVVFAGSVYGLGFVQQQFFPSSDRPELIGDVTLPQNATIAETRAQMDRLESHLKGDDDLTFWTSYVGEGAPRFILSYDVQTPQPNMGQIVIQSKSVEARNRIRAKLLTLAQTQFPGVDIFTKFLEVGPPVGRPVQYRISGPDIAALRDKARDLAATMASDPRMTNIVMDWNEPARVIRIEVLQDKARQLGLSSKDIASALNAVYDGQSITQLRDGQYLVTVSARGDKADRSSIDGLYNLQLSGFGGASIPLRSVAVFGYATEQPVIYQRNQMPTITVSGAIRGGDQPATLVAALSGKIDAFRASLPLGFTLATGGAVEESGKSQAPIAAVVPLMLFVMLTLIMVQMQGFRASFVVLCAAPLGLIGVVAALLPSGAPLGFVAILGVLALVGILIRNSIILVHEIEVLRADGMAPWTAVFTASDSRARPILLTAAAASLALIPISREIFWGPMAYAMMGGIIAGTIITLVFVPALYIAVFRVRPEEEEKG